MSWSAASEAPSRPSAPHTAVEVLGHVRLRVTGVDRTRALLLLGYCQAWHLAWHGTPLFDDHLVATEYGIVPPAAHRAFGTTPPRKLRTEDGQLRREVDAVIAHYARAGSTELLQHSRDLPPYREAVARGPETPSFADGPAVEAPSLRAWAVSLPAPTGETGTNPDTDFTTAPTRPGAAEAQAEEDLEKAKALREQLTARFDDSIDLALRESGRDSTD
ncbi:hypothetical protein [Brevibacterium litoralis]|uniref:hypothetical protein n=1 Tax=Brevibacterium litoralis TaxID=3138935 RepID=UPI0032EF7FC7